MYKMWQNDKFTVCREKFSNACGVQITHSECLQKTLRDDSRVLRLEPQGV